ncbi:MAG TPA: hypothetical protein PKC39_11310 [Ferruginibacter sp.]|nr:hypothetical protein [Ferruginibacter sp.]HMP21537.1 hypothetical protein [Ferruginibacter sp.]
MKKMFYSAFVLFVFLLFSIAFTGCKKSGSGGGGGEYYVKFRANSSNINYTNQMGLYFTATQSASSHIIIISGFNTAASNISLQVYSDAPITAGSYSNYSLSSGIPVGVIIGYQDESTGQLFNSGPITSDAVITITEVNTNFIKGSFSGTLKKSGLADINITAGEFYVKKNG